MSTQSVDFDRSNASFNLFAYLVRLFLTIVIFACLLVSLRLFGTVSTQSGQTLIFDSALLNQSLDSLHRVI